MAKVWNKQGVYCETAFDTLKNHWLFNPFSLNVHVFSEPPSRGDVWIPLSADLCSKVRFWSDFRCSKGPKRPLGDIFGQKGSKSSEAFVWKRSWSQPGRDLRAKTALLAPTYAHLATQNTPRAHFNRFGIYFGQLFDWFSQIVTVLLLRNCPGTVVRNCPGHNYLFFFRWTIFRPMAPQGPILMDLLAPQSDIKKQRFFDIAQKRPRTP